MRHLTYLLLIAAAFALSACGNNSSSGGFMPGAFTMNLNGGQASSQGGRGGLLNVTGMVGDLKFHATGTVDASFTVPTVNPNFGTNPVTVSSTSSVTFKNFTGHTFPASGQLFTTEDNNLYTSTGTAGTRVTGLTVNSGVILTFPRNDALNGGANTIINLPEAAIINGTVNVANDGQAITLGASFLQIGTSGTVTTAASGAGNNGGALTLNSSGYLINLGNVNSSGAASGGSAGAVTLNATGFLYNTGPVTALGKDNTGGAGGAGGAITLQSSKASVFTSGVISASGGNATNAAGNGGAAGAINVVSGAGADPGLIGKTVVGGTLTANGGNAANGNGGAAGINQLVSASGALIVNAALTFNGGNGVGAGAVGGTGGTLQLTNNVGLDAIDSHEASPQGMKVSGNIVLNGGTATGSSGLLIGGDGGQLLVTSVPSPTALPGTASVEFFGYTGITLNGGAGAAGGGGGEFQAMVNAPTVANVDLPAGAIINEVPVTAKGGDGSLTGSHAGGAGGTITFETPNAGAEAAATTTTTNSAPLDVSGGAGDVGGNAGQVSVSSYGTMTNTGTITAKGGNGTTLGGAGSNGVSLNGTSDVVNSGAINVAGGTGVTGGIGGAVHGNAGGHLTNSAGILAAGGNGTTNGGNGGLINLASQTAPTSTVTFGSLNVSKGTGGTTAIKGAIVIDGSDVTPATGIL